jgi:triphosphoribosyl-dephospho-CoA synthase
MNPDHIAQCAQAAMLIELSSSPKPGNVDRCHDFSDATFQQFMVSAVTSYPIFKKAAAREGQIGQLLLEAVKSWRFWKILGNTHFGSLILMIPLAMAAGKPGGKPNWPKEELSGILRESSVDDAINFYAAFELAKARVREVDEFSLKDNTSPQKLREQGKTLSQLMFLSQGHDLIAREWSTNYERTFQLADRLTEMIMIYGQNDGIVKTYLEALSYEPDSLVIAKFGVDKATEISLRAKKVLEDGTLEAIRQLDRELLDEDVNPGATADLIAASLFISLLRGFRF